MSKTLMVAMEFDEEPNADQDFYVDLAEWLDCREWSQGLVGCIETRPATDEDARALLREHERFRQPRIGVLEDIAARISERCPDLSVSVDPDEYDVDEAETDDPD